MKYIYLALLFTVMSISPALAWGKPDTNTVTLTETAHDLPWYMGHGYTFVAPTGMSGSGHGNNLDSYTNFFLSNGKGTIIFRRIDEDVESDCYYVVKKEKPDDANN